MARAPITEQFYMDLIEFFLDIRQQIVAIGADYDLGGMQTLALLLLDEHTPRPMKNYCGVLHCDASNVTGIIDGLEQKGLVERRNNPLDRRVKAIYILPAGKRLQQQILSRLAQDSELLFGSLRDTELEQLVAITRKLDSSNRLT